MNTRKVKTSELTGKALNWAVDWAEAGYPLRAIPHPSKPDEVIYFDNKHGVPLFDGVWRYSQEWNKGGPIIERERLTTMSHGDGWTAGIADGSIIEEGETLLIAAMRCYVVSKLGEEIDVPEELLK